MNKDVKCPNCENKQPWNKDNPFRPFCSERCKLIDLGEWASESHRIAGDDTLKLHSSLDNTDLSE